MSGTKVTTKPISFEEVLRAYFLRAGFFALRGVPFRFAGEDLTDIDLWLYERPTGTTRRVQICDIKYKQRPKAVERFFWTRGVAEALDVDGAYVATPDKRTSLRAVAKKLNLQLIDGVDLQRILASQSVLFENRITDEELISDIRKVDLAARDKSLQSTRDEILSSISDGFGAPSIVRSLGLLGTAATKLLTYAPNTDPARVAGRLVYLAAAVACESLDYVSVEAAFRSLDERRLLILDAVRYGALGSGAAPELKLALALVEKYDPSGRVAARRIESLVKEDLDGIPAEIVADQAARFLKHDQLFGIGRDLEMASYARVVPSFDGLDTASKSMLGAFLDFCGIERERFANSWTSPEEGKESAKPARKAAASQSALFESK